MFFILFVTSKFNMKNTCNTTEANHGGGKLPILHRTIIYFHSRFYRQIAREHNHLNPTFVG